MRVEGANAAESRGSEKRNSRSRSHGGNGEGVGSLGREEGEKKNNSVLKGLFKF